MRTWLVLLFILCNLSNAFSQDTDGDGVPNVSDLCPNTPTGTVVNAYGCPTSIITCDYSTSSFTLNLVGVAPTETRYLLVNSATGIIEQITTTPTFTGLSGTNTYMALAYSFTGSATGLTVGNQLSTLSTNCQDISNALLVKVCVPTVIPSMSINDVSVNENGATATLTVTLSAASSSVVTVNYATANNSAIAGSDYTTTNGTLTFAIGETSKTIIIPILDNTINEPTESFFVNLTSPIGATITDNQGLVTITDNDAPVLPTINTPTSLTVNENAGTASITVTLSSPSSSPITVNYATSNGSATNGSDYTATSGTLTFAPGETSKTILVPIADDLLTETTENFSVTLSSPSGATINGTGQTTISITDNDAVNPDTDGDGVPNVSDLCPNTPTGTVVNAYGCPTSIITCDFNTSTATFSLNTPAPAGKETRYVLADAVDGRIVQVSQTPTFSGLTGTKTYMVLAYSYENDGTLVNLTTNSFLNQVSTSCADWSNALLAKICAPFIPGGNCDYTTSSITLNTVTAAPSGATTQYVLVNPSGTIVQVSNTSTFNGLSGTNTYNAYAISYTGTINNLSVGSNYSSVSGTCYDWSSPISVNVCVCKPNICLPITINRIK